MKHLLTIIALIFCSISFGHLFQGITQLDKYEAEINELDQSLKSNPKRYLQLYPEVLKLQRESKDRLLEAVLYVYQGTYHYFTNNIDSAAFYFDKSMSISAEIGQDQVYRTAKIRKIFTDDYKKTKFQMAQEMKAIYIESYNQKDTINLLYSLNGLGIFYTAMDSLSWSMRIYYEALRVAELGNNLNEKAFFHNNLGLLKIDLGALDSAFSDFKQCLKIGEELDNIQLQSIGRLNMGLYYSKVDSNELAKEQYLMVDKIGKEFGYTLYSLTSTTNLASLEMSLGNPKVSDSLTDVALKIAKDGHIWYSVAPIYYGRVYYLLESKRYEEAMITLDSAKAYVKYGQYSELMPPYYHFKYRIYEEQGLDKKALEAYKEKIAVQDSLEEIGNAQLLAELQFRYDDEKKERIRNVKENKLKLQIKQGEVDLSKFRQKVIILISIFLVIMFIGIILYFRLKQKSDNLFSFTIANKLEEERGRIARDLHDGLGQSMVVLKNKFNNISTEDATAAENLNDNFSEVIEEMRTISRSLIPPELRRLGLQKAVESMMEDIEKSVGMIVTTDIDELSTFQLENHQSIRLYRIIQELCNNTIKHAGASSIKLEAILKNQDLFLVYQDNGSGLDLEKWRSAENSVGFKSIQQRLKYLKGSIKVEKPKKGFKVVIHIPKEL
jgi:two-component sensor histidine kinase/tetratricopeptide (TPR) repeat protein